MGKVLVSSFPRDKAILCTVTTLTLHTNRESVLHNFFYLNFHDFELDLRQPFSPAGNAKQEEDLRS